jgi:hypothetical protein
MLMARVDVLLVAHMAGTLVKDRRDRGVRMTQPGLTMKFTLDIVPPR